ncbi:MAG TPA: Wzt carbohydrate-binding domain-containing protein, partial [Patescibacteria group bacterium]
RYKEMGKTVILVTHDIATVQRYCDRALLLRNGKIVKIGSAEEVGNEYMEQNMSDEEKRIREEEKRRLAEEQERIKTEEKALEKIKKQEREEEMKRIKEEKKRIEEEKRKLKEEEKNKVAKITEVEFLDKDGKEKNVFETGDDMSVRVYFKLNKPIEKLNFGVALFDQENNYIFGINTVLDKIDTKKYINKEYFQVDYKNIPLKRNSYFIKAGIFGESDSQIHDFMNKSETFEVFSINKNQGLFELNYKWN